ncbi:methionine--tRNA ligase [Longicatena sp. 210702-DFI.1.36]|nr:methionine--tRNA ligase [Longicatena caecimuris]MCB6266477.1 methionine--tRNA ligase [Longicatena sp. 210702-DFI.1.160]MCB6317055.1 methionine--tRNA ligase [Longicatena sp. 210702-DFI.1.100]MCB6430912.1 methionine--tRNA ligase [Longicatena sp. 210702-DFI.1.36]MCB6433980.1 methionine--tRNA ligase [Longicatena sp. 210702-DFI.1.249]MCB6440488.1 methionine--tRNA ligase [Longicatena sp. 210702-DFI.1.255]MCB6457006.1 methionine--tRNA ligase [Longicatena sp. 210702-DFI.1.253]MCB7181241.1 methion
MVPRTFVLWRKFFFYKEAYVMCKECKKGKYYITTAITYTSGRPHIGNTYEIVLTDAIARYKRQQGYDVFFQTGTDEHGQKIEEKAKEAGVTPKEFVDKVADIVRKNFDMMNTSYDYFVRTTDEGHERQVQKIFKKLYEQGDIYKGKYEGMYCTPCESFWTESQLIDGKCPDCGRPVQKATEEAYFFNLQKYAPKLIKHIEEHPEFIQPESRKNEMINNFLKPGLQDLCVSRTSFKWGIPVDFDPDHVVYVWIDALSNYITSLGYDADGNHGENYKKYWPADVHIIGKDILRFHTIYWPIMLMALGEPLPKQVFGHPWLLVGDGKMSKSKGNAIYADELVHYFGVDAVRYFVLHEMPFAQDGTITWDLMVERINSDLANVLGNLVNRTISMQNKYFNGVISNPLEREDIDKELMDLALDTPKRVAKKMETLHVGDAIEEIFTLLKRCNKYIDETTPWVLGKDESKKDRLATVLYNLLESIRIAAVLLSSFMPETAEKILDELSTSERSAESLEEFGNLECGHTVDAKPEILFARIDVKEFMETLEKDKAKEAKEAAKASKKAEKKEAIEPSEITIDDFTKIELKVGTIIAAEKHPKADRLLVEQIDLGTETRQIVSGIAKTFEPKDVIGKKVVVVSNLKPVKLRGVESQGMILCASNDKDLDIVTILKDLPNGTKVS